MTTTDQHRDLDRRQDGAPAPVPEPAAQVWPLSPLQTGLLFHAVSSEGGLDVYSMQSTYAFAAGTDLGVLERACASLLGRHDALRAGFSATLLDRPVSFVPHRVALPWRLVDLRHAAPEDARAELDRIQVREREQRFTMDVPPLLRFVGVDAGPAGVFLVMTNHHIVLDGWSDALLVVELLRHVAAGGRDETLPPAPQFRDHLAWLGRRDAEADRAAWRRALSGLDAGTTLAEPGGAQESVFPDVVELDLGPALTDAVTSLARSAAVSPNTVYSTLWGLLLRSLTGHDDVVFGTTVSGRPADLPGVDAMVGLFLNTVPQRVRVQPGRSVVELLQQVQREQSALIEHHHVALGTIQNDAGLGPLFDTLYVMRNTPADDEALDALSAAVGLDDLDGGDATHYPATFVVHPGPSTRLILSHRSDVLTAARAAGLLQRAVRLLESMAAGPDRPVGALEVLEPETAAGLASSWTGHPEPLGTGSVVALLARAAARHGDRTALVAEGGPGQPARRLSFTETWAAVVTVARALREAGVGPGDLVTIELPRRADVVVSIFAVLAVGAAYVPVDPALPAARVAEIRRASGARLSVTPAFLAGVRPPGDETDSSGVTAADLHPAYRHDDLAYVMFTSGSTGRPKGVAVEHAGLVNMLQNHQRRIFAPAGASEAEAWRVAHTVSFAFDMSWEELLWLLDGHEVHVLGEDVRRDPALMTDHLRRHGIDVINVTPSVASALLAGGLLTPGTRSPRLVLLGGEAVGPDVWSALRDAPGTHGYNLYGPTEYTINTLGGGTQESATPIVGRAIDNTDVRVLDSGLQPVEDGVPGELYVTGVGLARGYHGAAALTAERFVADPYGAPGTRMYRTGDVVSRRADGCFDFHGRSDGQVKIRGHRVEPGEVAAVLAADSRVARCAVVARRPRAGTGSLALVGYVVPVAGVDLPAEQDDVLRGLRAVLPEAMVPSALVAVDDLPLTVNSKLDVAALPDPPLGRGASRPPRSPAEATACAVLAEVLGVDEVGPDDNFFALGGHSLLAMRAVALLTERLGQRVGVAALLSAPTPAGLVESLAQRTDPFAEVLPLGGRPDGGAPVLCLSPMLGLGWTFASLAARLPGSPPTFAVQSPALTRARDELPPTLAALAVHTADRLLAAGLDLPRTGATLVGWSLGAHLAHLLAAELEARGITVHALTLLDPGPPSGPAPEGVDPDDPEDDEQSTLDFLLSASLREVPPELGPPYDRGEVLDLLAEGSGTWAALTDADVDRLVAAQAYGARLLAAGSGHRVVRAPVTLVASTLAPVGGGQPDPDGDAAAWARWSVAPPRLRTVDIAHLLLTSPYASEQIAPLVGADPTSEGATR